MTGGRAPSHRAPVAAVGAMLLAGGCSVPPAPTVRVSAADAPAAVTGTPLISPGGPSIWTTEVEDAPVSPESRDLVENLSRQVEERYGGTAAFNVGRYGTSTWTAPWWVAGTDVHFDDCQGRGDVPAELYSGPASFVDVPIPATAAPSPGRDGQLTIYSPSRDQLWELWKARRGKKGWSACWGGRIDDTSTSRGFFEGSAGASASGLAVSAGALTVDDVTSGEVGHALSLAIPEVAHAPELSWPARRTDGRDPDPDAVPMGQRFRLDPSVDVEGLGLHPVAALAARAAQRYGFVVTDSSGAVSISADTGEAAVVPLGEADPWREILDGTPSYAVLEGFPWRDLEALPRDWRKPAR